MQFLAVIGLAGSRIAGVRDACSNSVDLELTGAR